MASQFYLTTPIYYVNDVPHIGHAYTTIAADVLARYHRLIGDEVFFLTGLDEHGQKVQQAAAKAGVEPQVHCDRLAPQFQNLWTRLNISNNGFIRTTQAPHKAYVQQTLQTLYDQKLIYSAEYSGWYCTFDERFWTEKDLENGLCPDCKRPVERLSERNYFFKMSQYQDRLIAHIQAHPEFIRPQSRCNEVLGFLQKPLEDLSISRPKSRLSWGIELPFDQDYVTYVWFDALVNYLSGPTYLGDAPHPTRYWPASLHLVGKDILTTHAVYWSTILMALERPLPATIFAHGWWTVNAEKMSKSRGNVVAPAAVVDEFGVDAFRYFVLREVPFGHDGDYSCEAMIGRINSELANGLGNLLSRTLTVIERNCGGVIPEPVPTEETDLEKELRAAAESLSSKLAQHLSTDKLEFNRALEAIGSLIQLGDQYIDRTAPWTLAKKPETRPRLQTVLYHTAETLRVLCWAITPFMPQTAEAMARQLGLDHAAEGPSRGHAAAWGTLTPGTKIAKGASLFPRIDQAKSTIQQGERRVSPDQPVAQPPSASQPAAPIGTAPAATPAAASAAPAQITIDDFVKVQLKVAKVLTAERIPKSEKLIKLQVDLGGEQRQIVAGIGKKYEPEQLLGRKIVIVANLKPAKLMGIESQGMVLAAGDKEVGGLVTIVEDVEPGTKVK
jgi:methionyl-tRNA synthetase